MGWYVTLLILSASVLLGQTQATQHSQCPPPWERMPSGKCVRRFLPKAKWYEAQNTCESYKSKLVEITSKDDDDYLAKWATGGDQTFHMGIKRAYHRFFYPSTGYYVQYANWDTGEPKSLGCGVKHFHGKWRASNCNNERPFVCERSFSVKNPGACSRDSLVVLVAIAIPPSNAIVTGVAWEWEVPNGTVVHVSDCGLGYVNRQGNAKCSNGVWKLTGCKEEKRHCKHNPPTAQYQSYPGWDSSYMIGDRTIFAEATYYCIPGYTRGDHKMVCQRNGRWSNPDCFRVDECNSTIKYCSRMERCVSTPHHVGGFTRCLCALGYERKGIECRERRDYCKVPRKVLERYNVKPNLSVGDINIPCLASRNQFARFSCAGKHEAYGVLSYEQKKCHGGPQCPRPWERMPSGKCVRRFLPKAKWHDAERTCFRYNSKLVEVTSKEDDDYLAKWATGGDQTFHMAVSNNILQGSQYHYFYSSSKRSLTFTNWDLHEPNDRYRCGVKYFFGEWRMGNCNDKRPFVCERYCPPAWREMPSGKCVQYFPKHLNSSSAETECKQWHGRLVEIESKLDDDYLSTLTNDHEIFLGLYVVHDNIRYSDGRDITYDNWDGGQLVHGDNLKCVAKSSKWQLVNCRDKKHFVCERRFDVDIPGGACVREDLLVLVASAIFPQTANLHSGLVVHVSDCGLGYVNRQGNAICSNGVWKLTGCKEVGNHCPNHIMPEYRDGVYPGWDGSYHIGDRTIFAEATYNCKNGYSRGDHKIVCQRDGTWSNPDCFMQG